MHCSQYYKQSIIEYYHTLGSKSAVHFDLHNSTQLFKMSFCLRARCSNYTRAIY